LDFSEVAGTPSMGLKFSGDSAKAEEFRARRRVVVFMIFFEIFHSDWRGIFPD
jgi:hypothetical protein